MRRWFFSFKLSGSRAGRSSSLALILVALLLILPVCSLLRLPVGSGASSEARMSSRSSRRPIPSNSKPTRHVHGGKGSSRGSAHARHHHHDAPHAKVSKTKYAYPLDFFMWKAPEFDRTPFDDEKSNRIQNAFACGIAGNVTPSQMVRAGVFKHYPLSGGIFRRRESVRYIVLHSTETGPPVPAKNVINAWSSGGRRHAGAQYVVDRDGTIYQAVDPELATVHVNIFKTLPGINNDNTIGIEMNHTGRQTYPAEQRTAVVRLVHYLQERFDVTSDNVITHKYAQQGDHTDPVGIDVEAFLSVKEAFRQKALAMKRLASPVVADEQNEEDAPVASVYVQIHGPIKLEGLEPPAAARKSEPAPPGRPSAGSTTTTTTTITKTTTTTTTTDAPSAVQGIGGGLDKKVPPASVPSAPRAEKRSDTGGTEKRLDTSGAPLPGSASGTKAPAEPSSTLEPSIIER